MKTIAVLGGGPAGSFAAERLASAGLNTIVFDEKLAWEKPCGGGLTFKAYHQYPFLLDNNTPKRMVKETWLHAPGAGGAKLALSHPLVIYSRFDLNRMLLERAERAGAQIEKARVNEVTRQGSGWRLRTSGGSLDADFCIIATGARNTLRNVGTEWTAADTMCAMGYYVPSQQEHIDIEFLPQIQGYIWVFPRCGHLSVGICGKGLPAQAMRRRLEAFMQERSMPLKDSQFYGHVIPSLETPAWRNNRVSGQGWLAVGDAGGLVDPITGEGLYYAMRSGDLASQVVLGENHAPAEKHRVYRALLMRDFVIDLAFGAGLASRFFGGRFLYGTVPQRMIQFMRRSPRFASLMQDLFAGTQSYLDLKARLLRNIHGTLFDTVTSFLFSRIVPSENRI